MAKNSALFRAELSRPIAQLFDATGKKVPGVSITRRAGECSLEVSLLAGPWIATKQGRYWLLVPRDEGVEVRRIAVFRRPRGRVQARDGEREAFSNTDSIEQWEAVARRSMGIHGVAVRALLRYHPDRNKTIQRGQVPDVR